MLVSCSTYLGRAAGQEIVCVEEIWIDACHSDVDACGPVRCCFVDATM